MSQPNEGRPSRSRILVAEDERIVALDLAGALDELGYDVPATVASGEDAVHKVAELRPDLVLMDIRLAGGIDGVQAAEKIGREFGTPVIYLTAHSDEETLRRAIATEPFGYLVKPFKSAQLRCMIETAIYKSRIDGRVRRHLETLALSDELTGLANRRGLTERLTHLMKDARRGREFVLVMLDVDHFKAVNDRHGHVIGDQVLVAFAATITRHLRDIDFAARFGGDEFCLLLVDTTAEQARLVLGRLRARLAEFPEPLTVTSSIGGCAYRMEFGLDAETLLSAADKALYQAKTLGRNRVEMAT